MPEFQLDVKFECSMKGHCCKDVTATDISFPEVLRLKDELTFMPTIRSFREELVHQLDTPHPVTKNAFSKVIRKHCQYKDGWYYLFAWTISKASKDPCLALSDDNMCTIHEKRPAICAYYPLSINYPPEWLPATDTELCRNCGGLDHGPYLIKSGRLLDTSVFPAVNNARQNIERDTLALGKGEYGQRIFHALNFSAIETEIPLTSVPALAAALKYHKKDCDYFRNEGELEEFVDSQAKVAKRLIGKSVWCAGTVRNLFCHIALDRLVKLGLDPFQDAYLITTNSMRKATVNQFDKPMRQLISELKQELGEVMEWESINEDAWMIPVWESGLGLEYL